MISLYKPGWCCHQVGIEWVPRHFEVVRLLVVDGKIKCAALD